MFKTTKALILREVKYKEADRILTVLTESDGKQTVKAQGALRKTSKFGAATQVLTFSELTLFGERGRWFVREGTVLDGFEGLRSDLESLSIAAYLAEVLEAVSDEDVPNPAVLQLGLNCLYALSRDLCPKEQVKAVFELRLACLSGYAPDLTGCVSCGRTDGPMAFSNSRGGLVCRTCGYGMQPVSPECLAAMRFVVNAPSRKIFSFSLTGDAAREFAVTSEVYLLNQLERNFSSLDYYKKIKG
ncbi:MAG: DNA repair protein RecO [Oscillospiraceae bacterium]|nr:DNA repair protein RecO [Oscillospiraceae bacterium]